MLRGTVIGNLGGDPELRYSNTGTAILSLNVASNDRTRDADGTPIETTTWVRVSVFGTRAEALMPLLHKGQRVYCEGRQQSRPWIDNQGQPRGGVEINADAIEFFSPKEEERFEPQQAAAPAAQRPSGAPASQTRRPVPAGATAPARGRQQPQQQAFEPEDDPF